MSRTAKRSLWIVICLVPVLTAGQLLAIEEPAGSGVAGLQQRHPDLDIAQGFEAPADLPARAADRARNSLIWSQVGAKAPVDRAELARVARQRFAAYLAARAPQLRIDAGEAANQLVTALSDAVVSIYVPQVVGGVPVRGAALSAVINNGNVALLGTTNWGDVTVGLEPTLSLERATAIFAWLRYSFCAFTLIA